MEHKMAVVGKLTRINLIILQNKKATLGLIMFMILGFTAVFAPLIAPYSYDTMKTGPNLAKPSHEHLMGTDNFGRDVFSRLVYGARVSFGISLLVMCVSFVIGVPLGLIAGYFGGKIDIVISNCANTVLSFPWVLMALAVTAVIGPGVKVVIVSLSITSSAPLIRLVRGITMSLREREFVYAAITVGETRRSILLRYIFPNTIAPIVVNCTLTLSSSILNEAAISFLGYGTQAPTPSWGLMLSNSSNYLWTSPHMCIFPGIAIVLLVLSINFLGDGLRDMLDPKYQRMVNNL